MLALAIHYLNGWAMAAADGARKQAAEWPPHPDRVFMALAAAHFETDGDAVERSALEWLEGLPPPHLSASDACERRPVVSYVPVNDSSDPLYTKYEKKVRREQAYSVMGSFSVGRNRQPRGFPVAIPRDPVVHVVWPKADTAAHQPALAQLCRKVTHIGHSASFVQMWLAEAPPAATWHPDSGAVAERRLRIPGAGRLAELQRCFNRADCLEYRDCAAAIVVAKDKEKKRLRSELAERFPIEPVSRRPEPGLWAGYTRPRPAIDPDIPASVFDSRLVVLALGGRRPSLRATLKLTAALRGALLAGCPQPLPEWISGHQMDGLPSRGAHAAVLPLPFVGAERADGRILGLALALPRALSSDDVRRCLAPWLTDEDGRPRVHHLFDAEWIDCVTSLEERETPPLNLCPETWTAAARRWATVTPVVLDRHHDGKDRWERACETVKDACERVGLPRPLEVALHPVSRIAGVPAAREFAPIERKGGGRLQHLHAVLLFERPVRGPIMIGAGRYRGYGLCRPDDPAEGYTDV